MKRRFKKSEPDLMKRRTLKPLRPQRFPELHHNGYVVLLDPAVGRIRKVRAENPGRDPKKLCVYVGMTGLTPEERFANHHAEPCVKRHGATHVHVHANDNEQSRLNEESDLLSNFNTSCNIAQN